MLKIFQEYKVEINTQNSLLAACRLKYRSPQTDWQKLHLKDIWKYKIHVCVLYIEESVFRN